MGKKLRISINIRLSDKIIQLWTGITVIHQYGVSGRERKGEETRSRIYYRRILCSQP